MRRALSRLRWQLTLSHLVAIAVTLLAMIAAVLFIASAWWTQSSNSALQPAEDARVVANGVGPLVIGELPAPTELSTVLRLVGSGDINLLSGLPSAAPDSARFHAPIGPSLTNIAYVVVIDHDGRVLGSSDPSGAGFAPSESAEWASVVAAALSGSTDPTRLVAVRTGGGPVAFGSYPILDQSGQAVAAALVAKSALPDASSSWNFWQALLFFGAASVAALAAASLFAFASSTLVSYFLSRRLVRRLERLGRAAESFAAGDLGQRVDAGHGDEVGQLGQRFNSMADHLAATLAELATEKRAVEEAFQTKRELVANVSHELRTPLASIRAHTESLLLRASANADSQSYLEVIHRQSEQLSRLIDDLFLLSTSEAGALSLVVRPVALDEIVEEVVHSIQSVARCERQVRVLSETEVDLPHVLADRQRVGQVLANLVRNAVRHTPEGGLVAVRTCRRDDRYALITVDDTGQGIPPEELEHVFERFYRIDRSRERSSGGAGLGLAIVRELVTMMGGEVSAESVVGEGSRFSFTLPFDRELAVDVDAQPLPSRTQSAAGRVR
jgi:signal transduction histidine kinase